jgi:hypothetical protein
LFRFPLLRDRLAFSQRLRLNLFSSTFGNTLELLPGRFDMRKFLVALALLGALGCAACNDQKSDTTAADKAAADKTAADKAAADAKDAADKAAADKAAADKAAEKPAEAPAAPAPSPTPAP